MEIIAIIGVGVLGFIAYLIYTIAQNMGIMVNNQAYFINFSTEKQDNRLKTRGKANESA